MIVFSSEVELRNVEAMFEASGKNSLKSCTTSFEFHTELNKSAWHTHTINHLPMPRKHVGVQDASRHMSQAERAFRGAPKGIVYE